MEIGAIFVNGMWPAEVPAISPAALPASTSDAPTFGASRYPRVAYFCMEYGLDVRFTSYAGGLGILAGDHMKSIGDLHLPLVGLGLLWDEGYTQQRIGHDGHPEDHYPKTDRSRLSPVPLRFPAME